MEAKVINQDGVFVITLSGQLDFESADSLRNTCRRLFKEKKVIFNLAHLNFVGSSGLTPFLELLGEMNKSHGKDIKLCSVSSEFVRLFEAGELYGLEVYENENGARQAFTGFVVAIGDSRVDAGALSGAANTVSKPTTISAAPVFVEESEDEESAVVTQAHSLGLEFEMAGEEFAAEEKLE
jgi:anti-anti-sigma factor